MENNENGRSLKDSSVWKEVALAGAVPIFFVVVSVTIGGISDGKQMAERILRGFALPCGLIWLGLLLSATLCFRSNQRLLGSLSLLLFIMHGTFGSQIFSSWVCELLESDYETVNPLTFEHCDIIIVLGGGVETIGADHVAPSAAGDRVVLAVRLYHANKADRLVFTGSQHSWRQSSMNIADGAALIAKQLGVPQSAIRTTSGRNTYEEFQFLKTEFGGQESVRIGVLTSATHMPRAMRLAKSVGMSVIPIPADFEREDRLPVMLALIPLADEYRSTERAFVEYLAGIVGR